MVKRWGMPTRRLSGESQSVKCEPRLTISPLVQTRYSQLKILVQYALEVLRAVRIVKSTSVTSGGHGTLPHHHTPFTQTSILNLLPHATRSPTPIRFAVTFTSAPSSSSTSAVSFVHHNKLCSSPSPSTSPRSHHSLAPGDPENA